MQWEKLASLTDAMAEKEAKENEENPDFPGLYFRVSAGERVRTVASVASQIRVDGRSGPALLDELRAIIWRNSGHRTYVVAATIHGEKSPLDSVTMYADPSELDHQELDPSKDGAVAALAAALVSTSRAADERAMFVASRNADMGAQLLDMAAQLAEARAELRMIDVIGELEQGADFSRALETFAATAGPVVGNLLAAKLGPMSAASTSDDSDPWEKTQRLVDELVNTMETNPGLLGSDGVPSPQSAALLMRLEVAARACMASPAQPGTSP